MLQEQSIVPVSGLQSFESLIDLRIYLKQLLTYYERQFDFYSHKVGSLMRMYEKEQKGKEIKKFNAEGWAKVGMLMVNTREPLLGTLEIMLETMEEYKIKLNRTKEVIVGFAELEDMNLPDRAEFTLYIRNGVPTRVLVTGAGSNQAMNLEASPQAVN